MNVHPFKVRPKCSSFVRPIFARFVSRKGTQIFTYTMKQIFKIRYLLLPFLVIGCCQAFRNPILDDVSPDPNILKYQNEYYMVFTQNNRIELLRSNTLSNFRNAERREIYRLPPGRGNLWAPEIHFIQGHLYIYFSMDDGQSDENHRMYVIKCLDPSWPMGNWSNEVRLLPEEELYAVDGTVLQYRNNELYFIWTGFPDSGGSMNLYIAKMENPERVIGPRTLLRTPTMDWERFGFPVNGGASILQTEFRTFLIFSGSSTFDPNYCLGVMGIDGGRDPLDPNEWWNDVDHCVFTNNDSENVWAPGHSTFVKSPDDSEVWFVYHASDDFNNIGDTRRARIQRLDWETNGPKFPHARGLHIDLDAPRGE